jgi:hypothetical protein
MCRLRGNVHTPEEASLLFTVASDEEAETTRLTSLDALKILCSELQDFISRMQSKGVH